MSAYLPPANAPIDEHGIIAVGGDFNSPEMVDILYEAYSKGIFPWPQKGLPPLWFSPDPRGILEFADLHISHSMKKFMRNCDWTISINQDFAKVINHCRKQPRPGQDGTWILTSMEKAYCKFFERGHILSLEVWNSDEKLIGGIYGVNVGGVFAGESMFHIETNASKFALIKMIEHLKSLGQSWMDIQMVTPLLSSFGGKYISRNEFLKRRGLVA